MTHYNHEYFNWQKNIGYVGGFLNKFKFENNVNKTDILMDFGCGGGYLLDNFEKNISLTQSPKLSLFLSMLKVTSYDSVDFKNIITIT